jgi:hypothetical protein
MELRASLGWSGEPAGVENAAAHPRMRVFAALQQQPIATHCASQNKGGPRAALK